MFTVGFFISLLVYIHCFITLNLGTVNLESCLASVSSAHSPSQIPASLSDGILSESIRVPVAKPQYLQNVQSSSLSSPEP